MIFTFLRSNCGFIFAMYPSSVVQTGVKSFGCENKMAHESPIQSWNRMRPSLVSASKSGAVSPIFMFSLLLLRGRLFQTQREKSIVTLRDQLAEFLQVNVAAGNDCDNRSFACFPAQSCSNRERSSAFGDDARFLGKQSHRLLGFLESDNETAIYNRFHPLP